VADETKNPVDLSELAALEKQILETDGIIEAQQRQLEEKLNALLDSYEETRKSLQKAVWAAQGIRVCPKCDNLKEANSFRYLYLEWGGDRLIRCFCAECYDEILKPVQSHYTKRLPAQRKEGKFFILWDGEFRAFEEIFDESSRTKISIIEEPRYWRDSLFTVGRSWNTERIKPIRRIKKPKTQT